MTGRDMQRVEVIDQAAPPAPRELSGHVLVISGIVAAILIALALTLALTLVTIGHRENLQRQQLRQQYEQCVRHGC